MEITLTDHALDITLARHLPDDLLVFLSDHLADMEPTAPPESRHALDPDALIGPGVRLWVARLNGQIVSTGALKALGKGHEELKSMRTHPGHRGKGHARIMLNALLTDARDRGVQRVSLETGAVDFFAPARALYESSGFTECAPFGTYVLDPNSVFMTRELTQD